MCTLGIYRFLSLNTEINVSLGSNLATQAARLPQTMQEQLDRCFMIQKDVAPHIAVSRLLLFSTRLVWLYQQISRDLRRGSGATRC